VMVQFMGWRGYDVGEHIREEEGKQCEAKKG
jgi:hypothetical protein